MKRFFAALLALVLFLALAVSPSFAENGRALLADARSAHYRRALTAIYQKYDTDTEIDETDPLALRRLLVCDYHGGRYGAVARAWDRNNDFAVLQYSTREDAAAALKKLQADGLIAEGDTRASLDSFEPSHFNPENGALLGVPTFINKTAMPAEETVVAVLDSGMMYDHQFFEGRMFSNGYDYSGDGNEDAYYDTDMNMSAKFYHSTAVCGIIADNTPANVKILPMKVADFAGSVNASGIVSACNEAVRLGAKVINASLYTSGNAANIQKAVDNALKKGAVVCTSAGNNGVEIANRYPTCTDGAIVASSVTALTDENSQITGWEHSGFSNYGDEVDFAAPGQSVRSCYPSESGIETRRYTGTSFSTPYISACCANLKSIQPDLTRDEVYETLCDFALDLGEEGKDIYYGNGVPDLSSIVYSDNETYTYKIPEGTLDVYASADYTADTQPWKRFANRMVSVTVDSAVEEIGDYMFCNMEHAAFTMPDTYRRVGACAFKNCVGITELTFPIDVTEVGSNAFAGIDDFTIHGYRNTPAEEYALVNEVNFDALGCKHNYVYEVFDPLDDREGYTLYTCTVCGDEYRGAYIQPTLLDDGQCGDTMHYYYYDTGKLALTGSGAMYDYMNTPAPWEAYKNDISILEIQKDVAELSPFAFYGCTGISKIRLSEKNPYFSGDTHNLLSEDGKTLILTVQYGELTLPDSVEHFNATALLAAGNISVIPNRHFTREGKLIYDTAGNIVCALPSYSEDTLALTRRISVADYAFILTQYPALLDTMQLHTPLGVYSLGYYYDGTMHKRDMTFRVCEASEACTYADENGFTVDGYNIGKCGEDLTWHYDESKKTLTFVGSGAMYHYASADAVPWSAYLSTVTKLVIDDHVTALSPYAFYNAAKLKTLIMPLSVQAPRDDTTWYNCKAITTLTLTLGSGCTDEYVTEDGALLYQFTPWFISRSSITAFSMDENVRHIGREAFRNCLAIKELTLREIERIGEDAFVACSNLKTVNIYSKTVQLPDYCIMSYRFGKTVGLYSGATMYAYADSTAHDYASRLGGNFVSLGCGHSRSVEEVSREETSCCTAEITYRCNDCGEEFTEYAAIGHTVTLTAYSTNGAKIPNPALLIDGEPFGTLDADGSLTGKLCCGTYTATLCVNGTPLYGFDVTVNGADTSLRATVRYADYVPDGVINAKDYAYALKEGYDDGALFDWGRVGDGDNEIVHIGSN